MGENRLMADLYEENQRLKERIKELEEKHWNECGQIAHYDDELKEAKRLLKSAVEDMYNSVNDVHCKYCSKWHTDQCQGTSHLDCYVENKFKWRYADEALALIGEDTNVPASKDDTNVGGKIDSWISCKDRMPDDNELVLFCYVGESGIKSVHYGYHQTVRGLGSSWGKISGGWRYCNDDVTHWMPLPEPPKDGDTNG